MQRTAIVLPADFRELTLPILIGCDDSDAAAMTADGDDVPEPVAVTALIDTGATESCVSVGVAARLGCTRLRSFPVRTPSGLIDVPAYSVSMRVPAVGGIALDRVIVTSMPAGHLDAIIGMDVLRRFVLTVNGPQCKAWLAW